MERGDRVLVASGEGWHEGVIGIVASRLVDRHARPVVLIALDGERGKGSGRSVSAYDLHAGLAACGEPPRALRRPPRRRRPQHLRGLGRAVRGRDARACGRAPARGGVRRGSVVDAVVAIGEVSLELARELARFEPCGYGNPGVNLLVPGAQLMGMQSMGEGGKHLRLQVADASAHCGAVAWGRGGEAESLHVGARHDVVCRLEINDWRGALSPRLVLRDIVPWPAREPVEPAPAARLGAAWPAAAAGEPVPVALAERAGRGEAALAALAGSGRPVVVLVADVERRLATLPDPRRYGARELLDLFAPRRPRRAGAGARGLRGRRRRGRRPPQLRPARGAARALGARTRARPARAPRGARGACGRRRARGDRSSRVGGRVRPRLRRGRRAAGRHGRALARGRAGCDDAARGAAGARRVAGRASAGRPRRCRARGAGRERGGGAQRRQGFARSPSRARATSPLLPPTPCTRAGGRARWRGWTHCSPGAPRTRPPRRRGACPHHGPGLTSGGRGYDEVSDVDSGTHPATRRAAPASGRRSHRGPAGGRRRDRHRARSSAPSRSPLSGTPTRFASRGSRTSCIRSGVARICAELRGRRRRDRRSVAARHGRGHRDDARGDRRRVRRRRRGCSSTA